MSFVEAWTSRIETDLTPFIDPGTTLALDSKGSVIEAVWSQRRRDVSAKFVIKNLSELTVEFGGKAYSYRAFFASESMADILGMAKGTLLVHRASTYVETQASTPDLIDREGAATDVISRLVSTRDNESELTSFVMVTGEAGAGKTSVLKELVRRQADKYVRGQADFVYLYIDAQGRALARFNEALATELNDLRVSLPIYAVAPMVKLGLIVPVIDGFDELLGVGGYDDAFSSISSFVEELRGMGALVASARSTYYEQEFLARANRAAQFGEHSWRLLSVVVKAWGSKEREDFVAKKAGGDKDAQKALSQKLNKVFSGENLPLGQKPLFVVRVGEFLSKGEDLSGEGRLLEQLVDAFLTREQSEKLKSKAGKPILTKDELRALCADFAEEMWNLGTRELDKVTVRELADLAMSESDATSADKAIVIERMPSMAFLQPGESQGSVSFEHELFFDLFLASRLAQKIIAANPGLSLVLGRSTMPESLAEGVAEQITGSLGYEFPKLAETLSVAAASFGAKQQFVRENAGRIVAHLICAARAQGESVTHMSLKEFAFPGSDLSGAVFESVTLTNVDFKRVDLVGSSFVNCIAERVLFDSPLIGNDTKLDIQGISVEEGFSGLRVVDEAGDGQIASIYDPERIQKYLKAADFPAAQLVEVVAVRDVDPVVVRLVERLAKAYSRCNPICAQDEYMASIFHDSNWPAVMKVAVAEGIIKPEDRDAHGARRQFFRKKVQPEHLLIGLRRESNVSDEVERFWIALEKQFPSPAKKGPAAT
jgi:hypothetical protein